MSDKMHDTRKLYPDKDTSEAPNNSHQIVVDKQEWEAMKRAANRIEARKARGNRIAAALAPLKNGIVATVNVPVNIVFGLWCVVWGALRCMLYACKYAVLGSGYAVCAALFGPSALNRAIDRCSEKCSHGVHNCRYSAIGMFSIVCMVVQISAIIGMGLGMDLRPHTNNSILLITATNILSLLYEIGRAKRNKGKVDVATTTPTVQTIMATAPEAQPATPPTPKSKVSDRIAKLMAQVTTETLPLAFGNASLAQLVQAGKYYYANPNITDTNFPAEASSNGQTEAILLGFNETVTTEEVEAVAEAMNLRLGTAKDGAHLGIQHPDRQRTNWLICLGDSWRDSGGDPHVVVLYDHAGYRELRLLYRSRRWDSDYRFLAFRKSR